MNPDGNIPDLISDLFSKELFGLSLFGLVISLFQILVIAYVFLGFYWRIRGTQAQRVLDGILMLTPVVICFYIFKLRIFIKLFELFLPAIVVGLIVLFAPEIRRFLANIGSSGLGWLNLLTWMKKENLFAKDDEPKTIESISREIGEAIENFSRNKMGALIVFDNTWSDRLYINSGRKLDAIVSTELLLNIFYPKSPLHDGAVLILNKRVYAASVILPITENPKLNPWQYGTRHRAALGISENSPSCFCLIVSEETGSISIAEQGKISKISTIEELIPLLENKLASFEK